MVERLNKTLKGKMWKYFTAIGKQEWNNELLQKIVNDYNNTIHSTIKETPSSASKNPELVKEINEENEENTEIKPKFEIGEYARIYKYKNKFEKGYTHSFTKEVFILDRIYYNI